MPVLVGTEHHPELFALISAFGLPYVLTWAHDESRRLPCVGFNHRKATAEATQHLIDLGHLEFAVVSAAVKNNDRVRQRLAGVTEMLERNGLALAPERLVQAPSPL
jgi:LacI family transcriptional regulator